MQIKDVMTQPAVTCTVDAPLTDVAGMMAAANCNVVLVVDAFGQLTGMLTDHDIYLAGLNYEKPLNEIQAGDVVARHVFSCRMDDGVDSVARLMSDLHISRLPVTDDYGEPVGMLSLYDVARAIAPLSRPSLRPAV
jgi:CBS domain-containing protein